jgi:hypothetical protein
MTTINLVQRGWEIFAIGIFGLVVSSAQVVTGRAMVPRWGKLLPDWLPREDHPGYFLWGVISMAAFGVLSVWYGISQVLQHSN